MALKPEEVLRPPIALVDELERYIDKYLLSIKGMHDQQIRVEIPTVLKLENNGEVRITHLSVQHRAELKNRYRRAGWSAEIEDVEGDSQDPREYSYTVLILTANG